MSWIDQAKVVNQINEELVRCGGAKANDNTNRGAEIYAQDLGSVEGEHHVRLCDDVDGEWSGPSRLVLERLASLPDGEYDDGKSWQRVWDAFPEGE